MKKLSLTIGIPAYNEEANIHLLINDLLKQKVKSVKLEFITVMSDGSNDDTVSRVKSIPSKRLKVIEGRIRKGRAVRQTEFFKSINTDIAILLDADIAINDQQFIEKLISPIARGMADLTSTRVIELPTHTLIQKTLVSSMDFKRRIFESHMQGNNIYTCHGRVRAFSKSLYKQLSFKHSNGEDAYSYLYCIANGLKYRFVVSTEIYYQIPTRFGDHASQSVRYFQSKIMYRKEFGEKLVTKNYMLPRKITIRAFFLTSLESPLLVIYLGIVSYLKIVSIFSRLNSTTWKMSITSKTLAR